MSGPAYLGGNVRKRIRRPSPALVISLIALFVALGGVGYAAATINGKNIKNKSIAGKKLKNKTVTGGKVKGNTLTGAQIRESSLGTVPNASKASNATNATNAANAAAVGGMSLRKIAYSSEAGSATSTIFSFKGLTLQATCGAGAALVVTATTSVNDALLQTWSNDTINLDTQSNQQQEAQGQFDTGESLGVFGGGVGLDGPVDFAEAGNISYWNPTGAVVEITYQGHGTPTAGAPDCVFAGVAAG